MEGVILGFDEYMNLVLDDADEGRRHRHADVKNNARICEETVLE
jgi:small nuclear ribonucleoprotein (snRNP)-like protein